jgi:hypothetical protein
MHPLHLHGTEHRPKFTFTFKQGYFDKLFALYTLPFVYGQQRMSSCVERIVLLDFIHRLVSQKIEE